MGENGGLHWVDDIVSRLASRAKGVEEPIVVNGGLSVSGIQHVGRLRGEILLSERVSRGVSESGVETVQYLTLYTQDPWKGKKEQLRAFRDEDEARSYIGVPLHRVPDPDGCHDSWVDHYWDDFGPYMGVFSNSDIKVVRTSDLYRGPLKDFIIGEVLPRREPVRILINKYRGRRPYGEGWIPIQPICGRCGRIDTTEALSIGSSGETVVYRCGFCGFKGESPVEDSKLNWRLEWVGVWRTLRVFYEPYGKDHAMPGGSRDSCVDLAVNVFGFTPPYGDWYEWVAVREAGREFDMTSSGFVGLTPREWLEVAHEEILRFIYFSHHPQKRIVLDPVMIPSYYSDFYRAERAYYGVEEGEGRELEYMSRTYEYSVFDKPPKSLPSQPPYLHVALLAQIIPEGMLPGEAIRRLTRTGHVDPGDEYSVERVKDLIWKARVWVEKYAPEGYKVSVPEDPPIEAYSNIRDAARLARLSEALAEVREWSEESIKRVLVEFGSGMVPSERREFYRDFYLSLLGKPSGPRAAPLLAVLPREFVVERLREPARRLSGPRGG